MARMESTKVLYISQEITHYLPETEISRISRFLPQGIQEKGFEIRTFMPRYGSINERRNQLHEVIRLSGMNIIINDHDHPLIIKVSSIPAARMQVYFIDNEDYFQRKHMLTDESNTFFEDNDERSIFFTKGVIETIKKLRWAPDIIHCHGWFTSFIPLYLKKVFHDDPLLSGSKVVFSVYNNEFTPALDLNVRKKVKFDDIPDKDIELLKSPNYINVTKMAINCSDGVVYASNTINPKVDEHIKAIKKPALPYPGEENYVDAYAAFYESIIK
jgi:starch synthase